MKKIITLIPLLFSVMAFGQKQNLLESFPLKDNKICYTEIVNFGDSINKDVLYSRAKKAIATIYNSANDVIKLDDKENGIIIVKAIMLKGHNNAISNPQLSYTLKIELKNNKYRYQIDNLNYRFDVMNYIPYYEGTFENWIVTLTKDQKKIQKGIPERIMSYNDDFMSIINSFKKIMSEKEEAW